MKSKLQRNILIFCSILIVFICAGSALSIKPARAQGGGSVFYDFSVDDQGWTSAIGSGNPCDASVPDPVYFSNAWHPGGMSGVYYLRLNSPTFTPSAIHNVTVHWHQDASWVGSGVHDVYAHIYGGSWGFVGTLLDTVGDHTDVVNADDTTVYDRIAVCADMFNPFWYYDVTIYLTGTPTATPTITPTFTPSPTPIAPPSGGGTLGKVCNILGLATSTFTGMPGKWVVSPGSEGSLPPHNPPGSGQGMLISDGSARISMPLDPNQQYSIYAAWHLTSTLGVTFPDHFTVTLGQGPPIDVDMPNSTSLQNYTSPNSIFAPNDTAGGVEFYDLVIEKAPNAGTDPGLVIDFVCVSQITTTPTGGSTTPVVLQAACKNCEYRPGDDLIGNIIKLLGWLWCAISQLWDCVAKKLFAGIWQTIVNILTFAAFVRAWAALIISRAVAWLNGDLTVLWNWIAGIFVNLLTAIFNIAGNIFKALGIADFFDAVLAFPGAILSAILSVVNWVVSGIQMAILVVRVIFDWIDNLFNTVMNLLGIVPEWVAAIVTGFNQSTETIPAWALACNDSNTLLYMPCLGMYVADNTILQGPVYILIPAVEGVVGINVLLWAIREIREMLSK